MTDAYALLTKTYADQSTEGLDPRQLSRDVLEQCGHYAKPAMAIMRAKCLDCCAGQPSEVAKCTSVGCALWPYRMGCSPFRAPPSEAQRANARRMAAKRQNQLRGNGKSEEGDAPVGESQFHTGEDNSRPFGSAGP